MKLIYFYLFLLFPFPSVPFCCFICEFFFHLPCYFGRLFLLIFVKEKKQGNGIRNDKDCRMDQAGILRKFIQGVKAMSEGDEERGEDNFGSDFMVGQHLHELESFTSYPPQANLSSQPPPFPQHPTPPGLLYPPGGEAGAATLPSSFSSRLQALHGGLALSPNPQKHHRLLFSFFLLSPFLFKYAYEDT